MLGMSERTFRRHVGRYQADGLDGLIDRAHRTEISSRRAPVDEVMVVVNVYQSRHDGWNVQHFHAWHRRDGVGTRSYSGVKNGENHADWTRRFRALNAAELECMNARRQHARELQRVLNPPQVRY